MMDGSCSASAPTRFRPAVARCAGATMSASNHTPLLSDVQLGANEAIAHGVTIALPPSSASIEVREILRVYFSLYALHEFRRLFFV